jgi:hypothetical protein
MRSQPPLGGHVYGLMPGCLIQFVSDRSCRTGQHWRSHLHFEEVSCSFDIRRPERPGWTVPTEIGFGCEQPRQEHREVSEQPDVMLGRNLDTPASPCQHHPAVHTEHVSDQIGLDTQLFEGLQDWRPLRAREKREGAFEQMRRRARRVVHDAPLCEDAIVLPGQLTIIRF